MQQKLRFLLISLSWHVARRQTGHPFEATSRELHLAQLFRNGKAEGQMWLPEGACRQ